MLPEDAFPPVTLFQSLLDAGWERYCFDYNGAFPPYVRIGMKFSLGGAGPCFESFVRDRIIFRTKRTFDDHFRKFRYVKISSNAAEHAYGRGWAEEVRFPVDRWLYLQPRTTLTRLSVWDPILQYQLEIGPELLNAAGDVELA